MALVSLRRVSKDVRSNGGAFGFATSGVVLSFFALCTAGAGGGAFADRGAALISRDGVAGALADSLVGAPPCIAVGAGVPVGSAGRDIGATVSASVCGEALGGGAIGVGGFTPAQPAVRSTQRSPTSATRINGSSARFPTEQSFIGFSGVDFREIADSAILKSSSYYLAVP